jgi:beta-glucosidase
MPIRKSTSLLAVILAGWAASIVQAGPAEQPAAQANPGKWPAAKSPAAITDTATENAISALLARMTLEQKVGQVIQADISAITPADLAKYPLGSILAGGNSGPYGNERADAATWQRLVGEFRDASRKAGAGIPILFGVDAVHGHSNLPGATIFPHNIGLGAARDPELIREIGAVTAAEIAGSGIEWTFAPTLAVPQDLRWGRSYEGYAADPALVAAYGRAMTQGLQGRLEPGKPLGARQVAATAKHFLADGGTFEGRDQGDARISEGELVARHAAGYPAAIDAGALTVMASFSSWNGVKHHGNASLLTGVLKQRMGFAGLVVGDWNGHGQVTGCTATHCPAAINAGLDLFMAPDSWRGLFEATVADVREGRISLSRLDDAVRRNLRVKFKLGLMGPAEVRRGEPALVGAPDHLALAREAVAKSLVLLKNDGNVLPLRPGARVLIAGPGADNMAMQAGGWTVTWQGTDTKAADFPNGQTIGAALAAAVKDAGGEAVVSPAGDKSVQPDVAIVVTGEPPYAEFQGDIPHLAFKPQHGEEALIARLRAQGTKVVVVFLSGRPLFTGKLINQADAFVAAWLPGTQGNGVADVLVARRGGKPVRDFTGRLPFAWPADARSFIAGPLFRTGYGLDYKRRARLGRVNEDPRIDLAAFDSATTFFRRGVVPAPWYLAADGEVSTRAVDLSAQEDARQFTWTGSGKFSIIGTPVDLTKQGQAGAALVLDWRIDSPAGLPVQLGIGGASLDVSRLVSTAAPGRIIEARIPLRCFTAAGANLAAVGEPLRIGAAAGLVVTIRTVRIEDGQGGDTCPAGQ